MGDTSLTTRLRDLYNQAVGPGPTPEEQRAQSEEYSRQMADLATPRGMISKGLAHILGPFSGLAPEAPIAAAAMGAGTGALNAYAADPEHGAGTMLGGAALGGATGGLAAKVFGGTPAARGVEEAPTRDPEAMRAVGKAGKQLIKELTPAEANARYRWVHTNSSEIQAADAAHQTSGEYGQLAQTLKGMAEKFPSPPATLYRGAHLPAEAVESMARSGRTGTRRMESWSTNPETSQAFALGKDIPGKVPVVFRQQNARGLALNPLESEVLVPSARDYKILRVNKTPDGTHIVDVAPNPNAKFSAAAHSLTAANASSPEEELKRRRSQ